MESSKHDKKPNHDFVVALREFLRSNNRLGTREELAVALTEYSKAQGERFRFEKVTIEGMLSRRQSCKDDYARLIQAYLVDQGLYYDKSRKAILEKDSEAHRKLISKTGDFQFVYNLGDRDWETKDPYFSSRLVSIDLDKVNWKLHGEFSNLQHTVNDNAVSLTNTGRMEIDLTGSNSDVILARCFVENDDLPPVSFLLHHAFVNGQGFYYGIGLGYQSSTRSSMISTRVLGLPKGLLGDGATKRIYKSQFPKHFEIMDSFFCGHFNRDSCSVTSVSEAFAPPSEEQYSSESRTMLAVFEALLNLKSGR